MDPIANMLHLILNFLLSFLELFVGFLIQALNLVVSFAQAIVGTVS